MLNDRPFAELAVVAGYEESQDSASAVQPSERFHPQLVAADTVEIDHDTELEQRDFFVQRTECLSLARIC